MSRGRPREFACDEVLEKAMNLFWEQGYEGTGVSELTACTGLGRQSLYNTFGDKRGLFLASLQRYVDTWGRLLRQGLQDPAVPPLARIEAMLTSWEGFKSEDACKGCLLVNTLAEHAVQDPEIAALLRGAVQGIEDAFAGALFEAQQRGDLHPEVNPRAVAQGLTALHQSLALMSRVNVPPSMIDGIIQSARSLVRPASS